MCESPWNFDCQVFPTLNRSERKSTFLWCVFLPNSFWHNDLFAFFTIHIKNQREIGFKTANGEQASHKGGHQTLQETKLKLYASLKKKNLRPRKLLSKAKRHTALLFHGQYQGKAIHEARHSATLNRQQDDEVILQDERDDSERRTKV